MADTFNKDIADRSKLTFLMRALRPSRTFLHFVQFLCIRYLAFVPVFLNIGADVRECRRTLVSHSQHEVSSPAAGLRLAAAEVVVDAAAVILAVVVARVLVLEVVGVVAEQ